VTDRGGGRRALIAGIRARAPAISLGLFAADPARLGAAVDGARAWGAGMLHFDVMDGCFVPQMTGGSAFVRALGDGMVRDVHLMVERPAAQADPFARAGADIVTVHAEAPDAKAALAAIRAAEGDLGRPILTGLALMPGTALDAVEAIGEPAPDLVVVLAVDPRERARSDVAGACRRLIELRRRTAGRDPVPLLGFDGGVDLATALAVAAAAPDIVVSGSAVFHADQPAAAFSALRRALAPAGPRASELR